MKNSFKMFLGTLGVAASLLAQAESFKLPVAVGVVNCKTNGSNYNCESQGFSDNSTLPVQIVELNESPEGILFGQYRVSINEHKMVVSVSAVQNLPGPRIYTLSVSEEKSSGKHPITEAVSSVYFQEGEKIPYVLHQGSSTDADDGSFSAPIIILGEAIPFSKQDIESSTALTLRGGK